MLHVKETGVCKRDIERNLQMVKDNFDLLGTTDGFNEMRNQIGVSKYLKRKNSLTMPEQKNFDSKRKERLDNQEKGLEFTKKHMTDLNEIKKEIKDKKRAREKGERDKLEAERQEAEDRKKREEEEKVQKADERKAEVDGKVAKIKEERDLKIKEMHENTKKQVQKKKMFNEMEQRYKTNVELPELERKKKTLDAIRDLHKPLKRDEIEEHGRKMEEIAR